jgi:hypothetical protein
MPFCATPGWGQNASPLPYRVKQAAKRQAKRLDAVLCYPGRNLTPGTLAFTRANLQKTGNLGKFYEFSQGMADFLGNITDGVVYNERERKTRNP